MLLDCHYPLLVLVGWFLFVGFRGINMRIAKCIHSTAAQFAGHLISMILRKNFLLKNDFHFNRLVTNKTCFV